MTRPEINEEEHHTNVQGESIKEFGLIILLNVGSKIEESYWSGMTHFDHVIVVIDKLLDNQMNENSYGNCQKIKNTLFQKNSKKSIVILEPETHVNAPVARNIALNYIRRNEPKYRNSMWLMADDDDEIIGNNCDNLFKAVKGRYNINDVISFYPPDSPNLRCFNPNKNTGFRRY